MIAPASASSVVSPREPAFTIPIARLDPVRLISLASESVVELTAVAVTAPAASTTTEPFAATRLVKVVSLLE